MTLAKQIPSKMIKGLYWGSTGLLSLMMLFSAFGYFTSEQMVVAFQHLGFPSYFRVELAIAKILGVVVILVPGKLILKEWAYAGFTITFLSAFIAHMSSGDPASVSIAPIIALILLITSYATFKRVR
ncbi:MAG: DoxX family protein [Bdellovibrionaceae bacterium]|nr:DoxX family protein [Pseudobdellovibrionaceae bacterium]